MTKIATRKDIDLLIQSTTVELFHDYGVAVAPTQRSSVRPQAHEPDCIGVITFSAPRFSGTLTLSVPSLVLQGMRDAPVALPALKDWVREIANQLLGRIKNRLLRFQVVLQVGLPVVGSSHASIDPKVPRAVYLFRTVRGRFSVAISGNLDPTALKFSASLSLPGEGEVILF